MCKFERLSLRFLLVLPKANSSGIEDAKHLAAMSKSHWSRVQYVSFKQLRGEQLHIEWVGKAAEEGRR